MTRAARILPALLLALSGAASAQTIVCTKMYFRPGVPSGNVCVPDTDFDDQGVVPFDPGHAEQAWGLRLKPARHPGRKAPHARRGR
jgi:hypothetical protein